MPSRHDTNAAEFIFVVDGRVIATGHFLTGNEAIRYRDAHHPAATVYLKVGMQGR